MNALALQEEDKEDKDDNLLVEPDYTEERGEEESRAGDGLCVGE